MNKSKFSLFQLTEQELLDGYLHWVACLEDWRYEFYFGVKR